MVRDGIYYALGMALAAAVLWWLTASTVVVAAPLLLAVFFLWFFRDPERAIPPEAGLLVSPADGKVTDITALQLDGRARTRISIFLSVFDVHVNRSPVSGMVAEVAYKQGQFGNAMDGASAEHNEQNVVAIEGEGHTVVLKQIAGLLARRIVFTKKTGDRVARGERVGLIKFGSRTDVIFPAEAEVLVKTGDRVKGGASVLARGLAPRTTPPPVASPVGERVEAAR